ncbi:MAG: OsmC family protein [Deltaproteobacteria bacterium]|nr:OsmC family protein [Deltaproteobacteria bacterium]
MKLNCVWKDKMTFTAESGGHQIHMDTKPPIGTDTAMTPKQLVLAGISGCTSMDVVALLKKYKQPLEALVVEVDASQTEGGYPQVFKEVKLVFRFKGALDEAKVLEAVRLSQTKYCGVSAMLAKAVPITYTVDLNGKNVGSGRADFSA